MGASGADERPPFLIRALQTVLRALLFAFAVGFGLGTWLRCAAEQAEPKALPYLGERVATGASDRPA